MGFDVTYVVNKNLQVAAEESSALAVKPINSGSLLVESGTWCWFSYPQAVRYDDYTFFGYVTPLGDIMAARYDHTNKTVTTAKLGTFEIDDHNTPAFLKLASGKIAVFYTRHSVDNVLRYRVSATNNGIDFGAEQTFNSPAGNVCYSQVHRLTTTNKILWFYRTNSTSWACRVSADDGATWSAEKVVFNFPAQAYMKSSIREAGNVILVALSTHPDHATSDHNVYAAFITDTLNVLTTPASGSVTLGNIDTGSSLPIAISSATLVYDWTKTGEKAWIWDTATFTGGESAITFSTLPSQQVHNYKYAFIDVAANWVVKAIVNDAGGTIADFREPSYSGGITLAKERKHRGKVYLSRKVDGRWVIEEWRTPDKGNTWSVKNIAVEDEFKLIRPQSVVNASDVKVMWISGAYAYYTEYLTDIKFA